MGAQIWGGLSSGQPSSGDVRSEDLAAASSRGSCQMAAYANHSSCWQKHVYPARQLDHPCLRSCQVMPPGALERSADHPCSRPCSKCRLPVVEDSKLQHANCVKSIAHLDTASG